MNKLPKLQPGDHVELIAPASRCSKELLENIIKILTSWQLQCIVDENIFGDDILCANTDAMRFQSLKNALQRPDTKAIICARGGYGSMRLIPELTKLTVPSINKLFVGMSDITALSLYFEQAWQWPTIHGALALDKFSDDSIAELKAVLFGEKNIKLDGIPLNEHARSGRTINAIITGGNLSIVQAGIGTQWQMQGKNKIVFLEEIAERAYRVDRMLQHLKQAKLFDGAAAILLGDFLGGNEPDGSSKIQAILQRFADEITVPVVQVAGLGHGATNHPLPLGIEAQLQLGLERAVLGYFDYACVASASI